VKDVVVNYLLSGAGISVAMIILARILPNEKLRSYAFAFGKLVSAIGCRRFGLATWDKIDRFLENSLGVLLEGFDAGLGSDKKESGVTPGNANQIPPPPDTPLTPGA
jgi:hypothetical protein